MSSGVINRYLRGSDDKDYTSDKASALRNIIGCDNAFDKCIVNKEITIFRGQPMSNRFLNSAKAVGFNEFNLIGMNIVNTAYSSTSLNMTSAVYFAYDKKFGTKDYKDIGHGMIFRTKLPVGTKAIYTHRFSTIKCFNS